MNKKELSEFIRWYFNIPKRYAGVTSCEERKLPPDKNLTILGIVFACLIFYLSYLIIRSVGTGVGPTILSSLSMTLFLVALGVALEFGYRSARKCIFKNEYFKGPSRFEVTQKMPILRGNCVSESRNVYISKQDNLVDVEIYMNFDNAIGTPSKLYCPIDHVSMLNRSYRWIKKSGSMNQKVQFDYDIVEGEKTTKCHGEFIWRTIDSSESNELKICIDAYFYNDPHLIALADAGALCTLYQIRSNGLTLSEHRI